MEAIWGNLGTVFNSGFTVQYSTSQVASMSYSIHGLYAAVVNTVLTSIVFSCLDGIVGAVRWLTIPVSEALRAKL